MASRPIHARLVAFCMLVLNACTAPVYAEEVLLQVKSFIRRVDLTDPKQFDPGNKSCQAAMAALVNCGTILGEDPKNGTKAEGSYRLWSELKVDVTCAGNKIAGWSVAPVSTDVGKEFGFISTTGGLNPALSAKPAVSGSSAVGEVTVSYRMRGQPADVANKTMSLVKPRTCTYIWHAVDAKLTCQAGKAHVGASIKTSGFPSHKLWVNGKLSKDVVQGSFDSLWTCDSVDPTLVR